MSHWLFKNLIKAYAKLFNMLFDGHYGICTHKSVQYTFILKMKYFGSVNRAKDYIEILMYSNFHPVFI